MASSWKIYLDCRSKIRRLVNKRKKSGVSVLSGQTRGERRFKSNRANFEYAKTKDQKNEEKQHDWFTTRKRAVRSSHVKQVPRQR